MTSYLAFLRGINVGGKSLIRMDALKTALSACGLSDVRTYIQSGNVIFNSESTDKDKLAGLITGCIKETFSHDVAVALFTAPEWRQVITGAPSWWGKDDAWRHNILILIRPYDTGDIRLLEDKLKPGMELLQIGNGVLYQSIDRNAVSRGATGSKLIANPLYKKMTIRNYNTATKLVALLSPDA